ncbi:MAG: hypothetical protein U0835_24570 [Isosphaeraceae bacterium]
MHGVALHHVGTRLDDLLTGLAEDDSRRRPRRIGDQLATTPEGRPGRLPLLMIHGYADTLACQGPLARHRPARSRVST